MVDRWFGVSRVHAVVLGIDIHTPGDFSSLYRARQDQ
jgi:hypothetical protein